MATFSELNDKTRSRKISLVKIRSSKRLKFFNVTAPYTYSKVSDFFVEKLNIDGTEYTKTTGSLSVNTFKYDIHTKTLSFKTDNIDPNSVYTVATYCHFYSNLPLILPYDLDSGESIEWESRLTDLGSVKLEVDYDNTNIALESDSSITLENTDGYFIGIFDSHIWENKDVEFYYWYETLLPSEAKLIYKGLTQEKSYSSRSVRFSLKDKFLTLRDNLKLNLFDETDGSYDDNLFLKPKRRIYGENSKLKVTGVDKLKGKFTGVGTISGTAGTTAVTGLGTDFLTSLCAGDRIKFYLPNETEATEINVQDITSNTAIVTSETIETSFSGLSFEVYTEVYSKHYNRVFNIAGHKLVELAQPILEVISDSIFRVDNMDGFEVGSLVELNGSTFTILKVYSNLLFLNQNVSPLPVIGNTIYRVPVFKAYYGDKELIYKRDFEINNVTSNCELVLYSNAEANVTLPTVTAFKMVFNSGSDHVDIANVDATKYFSPRDLIKPNSPIYSTYYEILTVEEHLVRLRTIFIGANYNDHGLHKKITYVADDTVVTVDCLGIAGDSGEWLRYPSEVVKHILTNDANQSVNSASFTDAKESAEFKISAYYPEEIGNESPVIRDTITNINKSVFGSLYYDSDYNFKYSILNSNKPIDLKNIYEDDILSYDVTTKNKIINRAKINFKPYTDMVTGEKATSALSGVSDFVNKMVGYSKEEILDTLLFSASDAQIVLNRYLFFNSLTNSVMRIKAKLNLSELNLNDPLRVNFDRIYKRYSGSDQSKIGIVNYIEKDETTTTVQIHDLGGLFNRVPSISDNALVDISGSTEESIAKYGFICDNLTEVPDNSETYLGSNLIG